MSEGAGAGDETKEGAARRPRAGGGRSARRRARELALQGLYGWLLAAGEGPEIARRLLAGEGGEQADAEHFRDLLCGVIDSAEALRAEFAGFIDRPVAGLSPVEHALLLIGTYELKHRPDVPYRVVINEAVELAKSFGGTDGFRYVNGVLDKVAARLRPDEAGRG